MVDMENKKNEQKNTQVITKVLLCLLFIIALVSASCTCNLVDGSVYIDCYGDLIPCANSTYNLGSTTRYWEDAYINNIYIGGDVYDDLVVTMTNIRPPAALFPVYRPYKQSQVPAFSDTAVNVLYFSAQLPHGYKEGSDLEFHIHLAYPDNGAGNSIWYFSYSWANIGDEFPVESTTTVTIASPTTTDRHQFAEIIPAIDGSSKEMSSILLCSIQRLGNHGDDTYGNEIYLLSGDFHYLVDKIGDIH